MLWNKLYDLAAKIVILITSPSATLFGIVPNEVQDGDVVVMPVHAEYPWVLRRIPANENQHGTYYQLIDLVFIETIESYGRAQLTILLSRASEKQLVVEFLIQ
ncbi:hypothetical protein AWENTII_002931 [Aspergillus wentii]